MDVRRSHKIRNSSLLEKIRMKNLAREARKIKMGHVARYWTNLSAEWFPWDRTRNRGRKG